MNTRHLQLSAHQYYYKPMATLISAFVLSAYDELDLQLPRATLDLGCSNGEFLDLLKRLLDTDQSVVGMDYHYPSVGEAQKAYSSNYQLLLAGDGARLPFADASFDLIIANMVLPAIPDTRAAAAEIFRVLKKGGQCVCTLRTGDFRRHYRLGRVLDGVGLKGLAERYRAYLDSRTGAIHVLRSSEQWREFFEQAGLRVASSRGAFPNFAVPVWDILTLPLFRAFGLLRLVQNHLLHTLSSRLQVKLFKRYCGMQQGAEEEGMSFVLFRLVKRC